MRGVCFVDVGGIYDDHRLNFLFNKALWCTIGSYLSLIIKPIKRTVANCNPCQV